MNHGDPPGKIGHQGDRKIPPDFSIDPVGNSRMPFFQGFADRDERVAAPVNGGGKPEETTDERPKGIITAPARKLVWRIWIQQNTGRLGVNPFQFVQKLFRSAFLPEVEAERKHLENGGLHEFGRLAANDALPEALDSDSPLEIGDLSLQLGVNFVESIEAGEIDFHASERGLDG
jgi:hypothetical protein